MEFHVFIPSPYHFSQPTTLIYSSILFSQCLPIVTQQRPICYGSSRRKRKRKLPPSLSPVLKRLVGRAFWTVFSSKSVLPPPLDLIVGEFVGGGGGGDYGSGGKSGPSGWGWGRRKGLGIWLVVIVIGFSLVIVKEFEINPQLGVMIGIGLGVGMMAFLQKLTWDYCSWFLGFGLLLLLGMGVKKEVMKSHVEKFLSGTTRRRNRKRFVFRK